MSNSNQMVKEYFLQVHSSNLKYFLMDISIGTKNSSAKLDQQRGILSRLRHIKNLNIQKIIYHSLPGSCLHYDAQLWGQTNMESINKIEVFQN